MSYSYAFFKLSLFFQNGYFIIPFMIWGLFYYDRKAFMTTSMFCLSASLINFYLKTYFQVPLNFEAVGHTGWAFPSGHTTLNSVLWFSLIILLRKRWTMYCAAAILPTGFAAMMYFQYHTFTDIVGGLVLALTCVVPLYIWNRYHFKKLYLLGFALVAISCGFLLAIPEVDLHDRLFANLGLLCGLVVCEYLKENQLSARLVYYKKRSLYYIISAISVMYLAVLSISLIGYKGMVDDFIIMFISSFLVLILAPLVVNRLLRERVKQAR